MTFGAHRYIHPTRLIRVRVGRPWAGIQGHWCRFVGFAASRFIPITLGAFSIVHFVAYPLYFVLGYLLIAAMYATGGAAMKDVHSGGAQGMVGIVPYLPMMFVAAIVEHPE